jgi:uncharacterized BrkB/YihY/UPF0761 family membrane protein
MGLTSKLMLSILVPITVLIGFIVTFSLISGKQKPFDLFSKIDAFMNNYFLIGIIILAVILTFGFFLFLKEKFLGSS